MKDSNYKVFSSTLGEIIDLREKAVLAGFSKDKVNDSRDNLPYSKHFVIQHRGDNQLLAGCSFVISKYGNGPSWQLYSVTIHSGLLLNIEGRAIEWLLLSEAMDQLIRNDPTTRTFWTDIPIGFVWMHERHGWKKVGEKFDIGDVPYQKIVKIIEN